MSELHVIFGTGPLGKWTARELVTMGKQVRMVNHSGKASGLPSEVEIVANDAYDVNGNMEVTRGAYAIYQCASLIIMNGWKSSRLYKRLSWMQLPRIRPG